MIYYKIDNYYYKLKMKLIILDNLWKILLWCFILSYLSRDINKQIKTEIIKSSAKDSKNPRNKYFCEYLYTAQNVDTKYKKINSSKNIKI